MDEYFIEEKSGYDKLLDFLVFIAVFIVTIFLILEIIGGAGTAGIDPGKINSIYLWINFGVFLVFILDLIRLWKQSENAKDFFEHNWLDVLATIPFELIAFAMAAYVNSISPDQSTVAVFGLLKWIRFAKLSRVGQVQKISRISKISKEFKAASHLKKEGEEYKRKHRL